MRIYKLKSSVRLHNGFCLNEFSILIFNLTCSTFFTAVIVRIKLSTIKPIKTQLHDIACKMYTKYSIMF